MGNHVCNFYHIHIAEIQKRLTGGSSQSVLHSSFQGGGGSGGRGVGEGAGGACVDDVQLIMCNQNQ